MSPLRNDPGTGSWIIPVSIFGASVLRFAQPSNNIDVRSQQDQG